MSVISFLCDKLLLPEMRNVDVDSEDRVRIHREILERKPMMQNVFRYFYTKCKKLDEKFFSTQKENIVELGAGSSPVKNYFPQVLTSDLVASPNLDLVVDAQSMPFEENSVRSIWGINCFHHFPDPDKFFKELIRVIEPGGGCILLDPYYSPVASRFFKDMCETEGFDKKQEHWVDNERLAMTGANQALTYIIFKRDRELFNKKYPELEIAYMNPLNNYLSYILCGGVNFIQLVPNFLSGLVKVFEILLLPFIKIFALHHILVIRKKK